MNTFFRQFSAAALLGFTAVAGAVTTPFTVGQLPNTALVGNTGSSLNGVTAYDGGGGAYTQAFTAIPGQATLDKIVWWGYVGQGSGADAFEVAINGAAQTITATNLTSVVDGVLLKYTLDIVDAPIAAGNGSLKIFNNQADFEWFWQGSTNVAWDGISTTFPVAFQLIGNFDSPNATPEPGTLALVALAGLGLLAARRAR